MKRHFCTIINVQLYVPCTCAAQFTFMQRYLFLQDLVRHHLKTIQLFKNLRKIFIIFSTYKKPLLYLSLCIFLYRICTIMYIAYFLTSKLFWYKRICNRQCNIRQEQHAVHTCIVIFLLHTIDKMNVRTIYSYV